MTDHEPPHVGTVLGDRYELVRHIARGGMGDVYEARDRMLQRPAAVKVYRAASPADRARFDAEVRVLARLNHPGLVQVYDAAPHGDDAYVVMELIDGEPLSGCVGGCPPDEVARIGRALADALAYIHAQGIVHRDVTPANVLRDQSGRVRLVDFGIVRMLEQPRVTSASITLGTPAFMSPEQVRGGEVTPATDVYSLGLVLLELLTGRREFQGTVQEVVMARLGRDPDVATGVPAAWQPLLRSMVRRDPQLRPSASEVAHRLAGLAAADPDATAALQTAALVPAFDLLAASAIDAVGAPTPADRPAWRRHAALFATAVAAAVIGLVLVSGLGDRQPLAPAADAGTSSSTTATTAPPAAERRAVQSPAPTDTSPVEELAPLDAAVPAGEEPAPAATVAPPVGGTPRRGSTATTSAPTTAPPAPSTTSPPTTTPTTTATTQAPATTQPEG